MRRAGIAASLVSLAIAAPAAAQERDYCPARPGLGDTPCTISPGRVSVETGIADWSHDASGGDRVDTITLADTRVRIGLGDAIEADLGWTPFVHERDRIGGGTTSASAAGDALLGLRWNLHHPDGNGFSIALEPYVTLPVGRAPAGAGDWSAGIVIPATLDIGHGLSLQSTSEFDAATDSDGHGRHFAASEVVGLAIPVTGALGLTLEAEGVHDADPAGTSDQFYAGASLAWSVSNDLQLDVGMAFGLNRAATDAELYAGISRRF